MGRRVGSASLEDDPLSAETHQAMLRPMLPADVPVLAAIYQASIETLTEEDYDEGQRNVWASAADDEPAFGATLAGCLTLVATIGGAPVGFIALEGKDSVKMLYVYPPATRQGVATLLYGAIEKLAVGRGAKLLTVDASDTAKPFFDAQGFEPQRRQTVMVGDCWLGNTRMQKTIGA